MFWTQLEERPASHFSSQQAETLTEPEGPWGNDPWVLDPTGHKDHRAPASWSPEGRVCPPAPGGYGRQRLPHPAAPAWGGTRVTAAWIPAEPHQAGHSAR